MQTFANRYRAAITGALEAIVADEDGALARARDAVAGALAADRLIHVAGSGHAHLIAEEAFYRAGGLAAAQAILDPDLMLHVSAVRSTDLEREHGRAETVLARYDVAAGDVVIVVSNSGRNAYPIETTLAARQRGATVIAITSLQHSRSVVSRHASGQRLFEIADIVLDNRAAPGDACLPVAPDAAPMGPTSTITGVFLVNTLFAEAVASLAARGIAVDVYRSANAAAGDAQARALTEKWRGRIRGL